jgi:hypothetical protein
MKHPLETNLLRQYELFFGPIFSKMGCRRTTGAVLPVAFLWFLSFLAKVKKELAAGLPQLGNLNRSSFSRPYKPNRKHGLTHLKPGDAAPDFNATTTNGTISLKDYRGKKARIIFWIKG